MLGMLIAYDEEGNVVGTLDYMVQYDETGNPLGLVDFEANEAAGGEHTNIWHVESAKGSKVWPEWIGGAAHEFRVELEGPPGGKRIAALVHKASGHRRERLAVEAAIAARIVAAAGKPADIRDLVGGPDRQLRLDGEGRTRPKEVVERPALPLARGNGMRP